MESDGGHQEPEGGRVVRFFGDFVAIMQTRLICNCGLSRPNPAQDGGTFRGTHRFFANAGSIRGDEDGDYGY